MAINTKWNNHRVSYHHQPSQEEEAVEEATEPFTLVFRRPVISVWASVASDWNARNILERARDSAHSEIATRFLAFQTLVFYSRNSRLNLMAAYHLQFTAGPWVAGKFHKPHGSCSRSLPIHWDAVQDKVVALKFRDYRLTFVLLLIMDWMEYLILFVLLLYNEWIAQGRTDVFDVCRLIE